MADATDKRHADLEARFASLLRRPVCQALREVLGRRPCHLVGGALRDIALGQHTRDLDVVVAGNGAAVAAALADRLGSRSIELGGHRFAAYRVTLQGFPIDIWDRGAVSLDADLRRRDFTIHSFAVDLHTGDLRDPCSGLEDLVRNRLRMTTPESFAEDPLRILRLCRFAAQLVGFRIDPATRTQARESVVDLAGVASERIRTEIELTLGQPRAAVAAELWTEMQVVPEALLCSSLGPARRRRLQVDLPRTWRTLERTAAALPVTSDLSSARIGLLLILLDRVGGLDATAALESLRQRGFLTKARSRQVSRLLGAGTLPDAESKQRWFLSRMGELWPGAVSLSAALADPEGNNEKGSASLVRAIDLATQRPDEIFDPPGLISGEDLQRHLGIEPGAQLGHILAAIRRQQIEGAIATRAGALEIAVRLLAASGQE